MHFRYIDIEARHLFFYFFESRRDPDRDDVLLWTNGGPGGSSSTGLFMELGPCRVTSPTNISFNPYSWNEYSNIFFIDQPIGVGFSYADHGETVSTTEEAAKDVAAFVAIFFEHFNKFKGRGFHLTGESYGGRYLPLFGSAIHDQNTKLSGADLTPINLKSVMIGNGCTDWLSMHKGHYEVQCTSVTTTPVQNIATCIDMRLRLPRCEKWYKEACIDQKDSISCSAASAFCAESITTPYTEIGLNPYDLTKKCDGSQLCYKIMDDIEKYLNQTSVRELIGADPAVKNYTGHSKLVNHAFWSALDPQFPTQYYIAALLERSVRVLLYVGANDFVCNWRGNEEMSLALEWTGQAAFSSQPLREWHVDGHVAGLTRSAGNFAFATINGAGHMVPYDMPVESLELLRKWLSGEEF
ncbi:uncharacterized protein PHACADRAFT_212318 [Phanerochaete carnosa HHB-10118-sp]|uniref:Carboxypeptidase n=1 Tax=Phanerochaete carnosa (strain HHB-10118-sp) TaxID=650164 RepID=K5WMY0_PHACS|nr:uncharacterized protein PHACADRAFT_212318 [Phanerochaete carnosa HHB-10118-sp]EKM51687.1 hypothetical protein PHACADRAFT_212318 [Phanerochaete carnosa HHB-10118-sp]